MGVVYRAHDEHLDREVALKVLLPGTIANDSARRKFRNEAFALSKLNHPNIATVHDFDTDNSLDFLVMELIEGVTLSAMLLEGSLPQKDVTSLGVQMAAGLAAAHDRGVIHRDLKPANLRITSDGRCKILDFGLAKLRLSANASPSTETMSETSLMAGTLPYMAPEQVLGGEIDARTDIHATGTVLYQMATGLPPFHSPDRSELVNEVLRSCPPPPDTLNPRLSPELARIITKCLERDPENRYQSAKELAIDLRHLQLSTQSPAEPPYAAHRSALGAKKKSLALIASLLALLVAGLGLWHFLSNSSKRASMSPPLPLDKQLAVLPFTVSDGDPQRVAFGAGLTETLTAKLTQLTRDPLLQVVPAPEVLRNRVDSVDGARKEFGVNLVLEGSLHTSGRQMRVNFILVEARTRRQLRANSLTLADDDAFHIEDAVVSAAFEMLGMDTRLTERAEQDPHRTQVAGAYDYYLQGVGYLQNYDRPQNVDNAIQLFQRALGLDKNYALAYAGLGEAFLQKYRFTQIAPTLQQARDSCRTANQLDPQLPTAHSCLGGLAVATGDYAKAVREFSLVLQREPTNDAAYKGLAKAYERMGKLEQAESTYKQAIALRPHYWATYNWLGAFYYNQARVHDASEMFRQVIALAPDSVRGYSNLAASLMDEGLYNDALHAAQRSIEIQPSDDAYSNLGSASFFLQRYNDAISAFQKATEVSPHDPLLWLNLGDGYYWAPGRRENASPAYQRCTEFASQQLDQNSKDSVTLGILAVCQAMLGRKESSFTSLNRALRLTPDDPSVLFFAALVHMQFDERDNALHYLTKCRAAGFPQPKLRDYPNFQPLHSDPNFQRLIQAPKTV
jgi:serine/threonine protein kinase/tetratricopeptide (TPR) repeat protein